MAGLEQPVYLCGKMQSPTGRTVRMVGMEAKRGRWKGVNGVCREVVKKAEVYYNRNMPSADRNAKIRIGQRLDTDSFDIV